MSLFQAFPSQKELFQGLEGMTKTEVPLVSPQPSFFVCCDWIRLCQLFTKLKFSSLDLEDWCDVCPESDLICLFTAHMCVLPLPIPCGPFSVQLGRVLESLPHSLSGALLLVLTCIVGVLPWRSEIDTVLSCFRC